MIMSTPVETANWLCECSDEEFAETFALMEIAMNGRGIPVKYDGETIVYNMNVDCVCNRIRNILKKYQQTK